MLNLYPTHITIEVAIAWVNIIYPPAPNIVLHAKQQIVFTHLLYISGPIMSFIKPRGFVISNETRPVGSDKVGYIYRYI